MKVKDLMHVLPINVNRVYRDRTNGIIIDYYNMNRIDKMNFRERTIYLMTPTKKNEIDVLVYEC